MNGAIEAVLVIGLAVWQAVEVWRHSSLFAGWRAVVESQPSWEFIRKPYMRQMRGLRFAKFRAGMFRRFVQGVRFLCDLLLCPWCLSIWVGVSMAAAWMLLPAGWRWLNVATVGLAASRVANFMNDVTMSIELSRTPRHDRLPPYLPDPITENRNERAG